MIDTPTPDEPQAAPTAVARLLEAVVFALSYEPTIGAAIYRDGLIQRDVAHALSELRAAAVALRAEIARGWHGPLNKTGFIMSRNDLEMIKAEAIREHDAQNACGHGHPPGALHAGDEGTHHCRWCEGLGQAARAALEPLRSTGVTPEWCEAQARAHANERPQDEARFRALAAALRKALETAK